MNTQVYERELLQHENEEDSSDDEDTILYTYSITNQLSHIS